MGVCGNLKENRKRKVNEVEISESPLTVLDKSISLVSPSICRIKFFNRNGTGFLIKLKIYNEKELFFLMTNEHVITREIVDSKENIEIFYDYKSERKEIDLNKDKRIIKDYKDLDIDIIIIQILEEDNIDKKYFLTPYLGEIFNLKGKRIYITQFPKGDNLCFSKGYIKRIKNYELIYNATTDMGSSGSPIFLENSREVIGIHKQGNIEKTENYGNFLYPIIESLKFENKIIKNKIENNEKYIYENGDYYIGEWLNNLKHGKGKLYYKNGKIKYEGDFIKDKFDGYGKYIYENGEYYIGQWQKNLKHGKGTYYYKNGKIKYEGDFIKNKLEGNGKYIYENGEYYIGEWSNWLKHGEGTLYYKNGKIKYEGDFIKDKFEGYGKYIYENGEYYIGQWLNDEMHGKGKIYYKNDKIKYKGDFIKNKLEGNGKYIYENGEYYIGEWLNNLKHGKGKLYYKNGKIKYEGDFIKNKFEGNGKYIYENGEYYIGQWLNDEMHGKGTYYYKNGKIKYEGDFIKNKSEEDEN